MRILIKSIIVAAFVLIGSKVWALTPLTPVFQTTHNNNQFVVTHSTISISSTTVTAVTAVYGYQSVTIQLLPTAGQDGELLYYRMDGVSTNMSNGYVIRVTTQTAGVSLANPVQSFDIDTSNTINLQLAAGSGVTAVAANMTQRRRSSP